MGTGDEIGAVLSWGSRAAPILQPFRSQQYEFFVTISLFFATKAPSPGAFLQRQTSRMKPAKPSPRTLEDQENLSAWCGTITIFYIFYRVSLAHASWPPHAPS